MLYNLECWMRNLMGWYWCQMFQLTATSVGRIWKNGIVTLRHWVRQTQANSAGLDQISPEALRSDCYGSCLIKVSSVCCYFWILVLCYTVRVSVRPSIRLSPTKCLDSGYLVCATPHTVLCWSFLNFPDVFVMVWRCACGLDIHVIFRLIFVTFSAFWT